MPRRRRSSATWKIDAPNPRAATKHSSRWFRIFASCGRPETALLSRLTRLRVFGGLRTDHAVQSQRRADRRVRVLTNDAVHARRPTLFACLLITWTTRYARRLHRHPSAGASAFARGRRAPAEPRGAFFFRPRQTVSLSPTEYRRPQGCLVRIEIARAS